MEIEYYVRPVTPDGVFRCLYREAGKNPERDWNFFGVTPPPTGPDAITSLRQHLGLQFNESPSDIVLTEMTVVKKGLPIEAPTYEVQTLEFVPAAKESEPEQE